MIKQTVPESLDCQEKVDATSNKLPRNNYDHHYGQGLHGDHIWHYGVWHYGVEGIKPINTVRIPP